jgi:hypothetical protein
MLEQVFLKVSADAAVDDEYLIAVTTEYLRSLSAHARMAEPVFYIYMNLYMNTETERERERERETSHTHTHTHTHTNYTHAHTQICL